MTSKKTGSSISLFRGVSRSKARSGDVPFRISPPPTRRAASTARLTRLLLSSDLLRVAAWVAVGLCLGSGFALVVGVYCFLSESPAAPPC